jgi:hypothetical protein
MLTLGIDLAQARDRTALIALDSYRVEPDVSLEEINAMNSVRDALHRRRLRTPKRQLHHEIVHIQRFKAGMTYPAQVSAIITAADALSTEEVAHIVIDATGVGRPVVDMLRQECTTYPLTAVTITGGTEQTRSGRNVSVPKADLVGLIETVISQQRLHAVPGLPQSDDLDKELRAFGYELGPTGKPRYEGKGAHDDLVTGLSLALWGSEKGVGSGASFKEFMRQDMARRRGGYLDGMYA